MSYLLDTNVVSEWTRSRPEPTVVRWLNGLDEDRVFLSVLTIAELQQGIELLSAGSKRERLAAWVAEDLLVRFEDRLLPVTSDIALEWGRVSAKRQRAGRPIGAIDAFFAATCRVHALTLATRNDHDFVDTGLTVLNPWA